MKFEVVDRKEIKEGLIRKKSKFMCTVKLDFDDEEMATLTEMCKNPVYELEEVASFQDNIDMSVHTFVLGNIQKKAEKNAGIYDWPIRMNSAEDREITVSEFKDMAKHVKKRIDIFRHVEAVGSSDTVEEL